MYCWPYQLKVWWGHGPTCHTYSALHAIWHIIVERKTFEV